MKKAKVTELIGDEIIIHSWVSVCPRLCQMYRDNLIISFGEWQPWFWFGYEATVQEVDLTATTLLDTGKKNKKKVSVGWISFFLGGGQKWPDLVLFKQF